MLQDCEFWTNLGDGTITGDATLKAVFTRLLNIHYGETLLTLQLATGRDGVEDTNYTDHQFSTFTITENVNNYQFLTDEDGNTITDITGVMIQPETSSEYRPLTRLTLDDPRAMLVMSPNTDNTGTPSAYLEKNNMIFFDVLPDYTKAAAGKLFYRLVPSYFTTSDTTKEPGFVEGFHRRLSLKSSLDWLRVNKPENATLLGEVKGEIAILDEKLDAYVRQKNPTKSIIRGSSHSTR
ncbi:MAG: hypothetical protein KF889_01580 [Alphaproteobacteria bacterium]|nr:hypothetical protein [Alphaproteobacteria bacterium]